MEMKYPGRPATINDCSGGMLVCAEGRTGIVMHHTAADVLSPTRQIVDVWNGEVVELSRHAMATVYDKARVVLE